MSEPLTKYIFEVDRGEGDHDEPFYSAGEVDDLLAALRQQLAAAEALCAEMTETLQALCDVQNGCPLPKYETDWNAAMKRADRYLHPPKGRQHDGRTSKA